MGYKALDYDILNDYGETDYIIDLFEEIEKAYYGIKSIFDKFTKDDIILAFFPCTRFECQCSINFRGEGHQMESWDDKKKLEYDLYQFDGLARNYKTITKLAIVAISRGLRVVIENPANKPHFLTSYWAIKPSIVDLDRRKDGDIYRKPTQYFFIGFTPSNNLVFESLDYVKAETIGAKNGKERSEIHPQYASRFLRKYVL